MALIPVPLIGQTLNASRAPINSNFAAIGAAFLEDHVGYNDPGQGRHNRISFPTQSSAPAAQAAIVQLYSQLSTLTTQPELMYERQSGSTAPTAVQIAEFTSAGWANPGWTRLPSGILLKWHTGIGFGGANFVSINLNNDGLNVLPNAPNFDTVLNIMTTTFDTNGLYNNVIGIGSFVQATKIVKFVAFNGAIPPISVTVAYLAIGF
jgi:hypothetical protein